MEMNPEPGPIIKKKPPDAIAEIPPAEKPDGDNIVWIPGYWSWDDDRQDYIWVSGVYRAAPPYQTWVPGYWEEVERGFQWTPGFWTAAAKNDVDYVPTPPPQSLENGPEQSATFGESILGAGHLGLSECECRATVCLADRILDGRASQIGFLFRRTGCGRRADTCSSTVIGITRFRGAAVCSRRCITVRRYT